MPTIWRMRLLVGLHDAAEADLRPQRLLGRDRPVLALDVVGRLARPDRQHLVDRLDEHLLPVLVEDAERLGIGAQHAGADPHDETALEQVVDHRRVGGDDGGMAVRQVDHRGAELDLLGDAEQRRDEHHAVGDVLDFVGEVLAAIALGVAEPIGEDERLAVLLQRLGIVPALRVDRHGEKAKVHHRPAAVFVGKVALCVLCCQRIGPAFMRSRAGKQRDRAFGGAVSR